MDHYQQELALVSHILHRTYLCFLSYHKNKSSHLLLVQELVLEQARTEAVEAVPVAVVADKRPAVELVIVPAVASAFAAYCC